VENIDSLIKKGSDFYIGLPIEVTNNIETFLASLSNHLIKILNSFIKLIFSTAISIPEAVVFIIVTVLSTYFLSSDREKIYGYFRARLPKSLVQSIVNVRNDLFSALFGYIKAQFILMSITFFELFTGFMIIHINQPLAIALAIGLIDALPILGAGSVLIPWLIYEFLTGNAKLGSSLLIIYIIVLIVRQMIEPKILSYHIGIHPLLTLIAMYTGLKLFGILGLILGPITILLLKNILSGIFKNKSLKEVVYKHSSKSSF
jgi:sporulation integral membrane protein YtvI